MTNEEIVKALRCISTEGNVAPDCKGCPFYKREQLDPKLAEELGIIGQGEWYSCDCNAVGFAAADLIENQQNHIRALLQANDALRQRWIPVTERLPVPKTEDYVLACVTWKNQSIDYQNAVVMALVSEEGFVDVEMDCVLEGVTHWMPLPPAPEVD